MAGTVLGKRSARGEADQGEAGSGCGPELLQLQRQVRRYRGLVDLLVPLPGAVLGRPSARWPWVHIVSGRRRCADTDLTPALREPPRCLALTVRGPDARQRARGRGPSGHRRRYGSRRAEVRAFAAVFQAVPSPAGEQPKSTDMSTRGWRSRCWVRAQARRVVVDDEVIDAEQKLRKPFRLALSPPALDGDRTSSKAPTRTREPLLGQAM